MYSYSRGMADLLALFTQAAKLLREAADEAMGPHGVRVGQHIVLSALWDEDGLTPGEIARRIGVATPAIVNTASRSTPGPRHSRTPASALAITRHPRCASAAPPVE